VALLVSVGNLEGWRFDVRQRVPMIRVSGACLVSGFSVAVLELDRVSSLAPTVMKF
jgi:hypothetical protein